MCLGVWTLKHPDYALYVLPSSAGSCAHPASQYRILGSNRDEFLARPTLGAKWHSFGQAQENGEDKELVISGLDVLAGGTWLGINKRGDVAML
jgi:uncharacterized protein with NRDE domain